MASQVYCKVDGIPGESSDDKHKDYFEVLSYSHGVSQESSGSESAAGGHSGGRSDHDRFAVTKHLDKASPKLNYACSKGDHITEVLIECWRHIGDNQKYMEYKLTDAIVRSIHPSGNGEGRPTETVTFSYARIDWAYTEFDNKGKKKGDVKTHWDLEKGKGG